MKGKEETSAEQGTRGGIGGSGEGERRRWRAPILEKLSHP